MDQPGKVANPTHGQLNYIHMYVYDYDARAHVSTIVPPKLYTIYFRVRTGGKAWRNRARAIARRARETGKRKKQQIYSRLRTI